MKARLLEILKFAGASGAGLLLDYAIYTALCEAGLPAGWANLISASAGVTFVFLVSAHRIFDATGHFLTRLFVVYALFQLVAVTAASALVGTMTAVLDGQYLLGKTAVLPLTFTANYLFMAWLMTPLRRRAVTA